MVRELGIIGRPAGSLVRDSLGIGPLQVAANWADAARGGPSCLGDRPSAVPDYAE
jgi:hypothetical protein